MSATTRERILLLDDLRRQLPRLGERGRRRTERAIACLERELAPGRERERKAVNR